MYKLKQKNVTGAKPILNSLWGKLCKSKIIKLNNVKEIDYKPDRYNLVVTFNDDDEMKAEIDTNIFEYSFARMKPFILAKGRYVISKIIEKDIDNLVYLHTDGFILTTETQSKTGTNIGDLKYEGHDPKCKIKSNKYIFNCQDSE